jgi:hypothetical protein
LSIIYTADPSNYEILSKINNGEPVTAENLREAAERYLVTKAALTMTELEFLKEKLAGGHI